MGDKDSETPIFGSRSIRNGSVSTPMANCEADMEARFKPTANSSLPMLRTCSPSDLQVTRKNVTHQSQSSHDVMEKRSSGRSSGSRSPLCFKQAGPRSEDERLDRETEYLRNLPADSLQNSVVYEQHQETLRSQSLLKQKHLEDAPMEFAHNDKQQQQLTGSNNSN